MKAFEGSRSGGRSYQSESRESGVGSRKEKRRILGAVGGSAGKTGRYIASISNRSHQSERRESGVGSRKEKRRILGAVGGSAGRTGRYVWGQRPVRSDRYRRRGHRPVEPAAAKAEHEVWLGWQCCRAFAGLSGTVPSIPMLGPRSDKAPDLCHELPSIG
jgi:hypothetical protein